jgi:hypothetical protein
MKNLFILSIALLILSACMGQDERTILDYLNSKLTPAAGKVTHVEIISEDSVLSFSPLYIMQNEYLRTLQDSVLSNMHAYLKQATAARNNAMAGAIIDTTTITHGQYNWRRILKIKATGDDGRTRDNIEVVFDNDRITPMSLGREYDEDLMGWYNKVEQLRHTLDF